MRRALFALGAAVITMAVLLPGAFGRTQATPGVTAKTITLGGTFPLSGPASSYAPIPRRHGGVLQLRRTRRKGPDGKRGVDGRQIVWKYYDDGYNPANTVQRTHQLVEQDHVFALIGGLGTEPQPGGRGLPEPAEGAAGLRLDRRDGVRLRVREVPVDDRLAA